MGLTSGNDFRRTTEVLDACGRMAGTSALRGEEEFPDERTIKRLVVESVMRPWPNLQRRTTAVLHVDEGHLWNTNNKIRQEAINTRVRWVEGTDC